MKVNLKKKGFTIVELVITLSIISILMAVSLMCYSYVISKNNDRAAANLGRGIFDVAKQQYEKDDFTICVENIDEKVEKSFNCSVDVQNIDESSIRIGYLYMNTQYSLQGNFRNDNVIIQNSESGEMAYEN